MRRREEQDEMLVLARLVEYVKKEAMQAISDRTIRERISAYAAAVVAALDEAYRKRKWR